MNSFLPVVNQSCAFYVMFVPSVPVLSTFQLCHLAVPYLRKDLPSAWHPEPVLITDCSLKINTNKEQLSKQGASLTFTRLLGSGAAFGTVTQTVWHCSPGQQMTCIPKGAVDSNIPSPVDRPDGETMLGNYVSYARAWWQCKKKLICCENTGTLNQVVRRSYGVSILGGTQNTIGHDPQHPHPAMLVLSRGFGLDDLQSSLSASAPLWFCSLQVP